MVPKVVQYISVSSLLGIFYLICKSIYNYNYAKDSDIIFQELRPNCMICGAVKLKYKNVCPHGSGVKPLYDELEAATKSIDICMYLFTDRFIYSILLKKFKDGVQIRIITDAEMVFATKGCIPPLYEAGVPVKFFDSIYPMHLKFCIIDKKVVSTGSFNWTEQAVKGNYESLIVLKTPRYVKKFIDVFEDRWSKFAPFTNDPTYSTSKYVQFQEEVVSRREEL